VAGVLAAVAADRATTFKGLAAAVFAVPVSSEVVDWIWGMSLQMGPRGDDSLRDLAETDQRKIAAALEVPVLLLHGRKDGVAAFSGAEAARDVYPDARLVEFPECGHATFLEDRDTYLAELTGFLNQ